MFQRFLHDAKGIEPKVAKSKPAYHLPCESTVIFEGSQHLNPWQLLDETLFERGCQPL